MQRLTDSDAWQLFKGYVVIFLTGLFVVSAVVGLALIFDAIAEAVR